MKVFKEDIKKKNKKSALPFINKNAGNVEYNISMFNKMSSPIEGPNTNPISGSSGENVGGEGMGESIINNPARQKSTDEYGKKEMGKRHIVKEKETHLSEATEKETVDLDYTGMYIDVCTRRGNPTGYYNTSIGGWLPDDDDTCEVKIDYTYTVDKKDVLDFLADMCIEHEFTEEQVEDHDDWDEFVDTYVNDHFNELMEKYHNQLLDYFYDDAHDQAEEENYHSYYDESLKSTRCLEGKKKKKRKGVFVNLNAGNVEANNTFFNKAASSSEGVPTSATADGTVGAAGAVGESVEYTKTFKVQYLRFPNPRRDDYEFITTTIEADSKEDAYQKMRKFFNQNKVYYRDLLIYQ